MHHTVLMNMRVCATMMNNEQTGGHERSAGEARTTGGFICLHAMNKQHIFRTM